jgi:hypothetical protein
LRGKTVLRRHVGVKVGFYGILQTVYKLKKHSLSVSPMEIKPSQ